MIQMFPAQGKGAERANASGRGPRKEASGTGSSAIARRTLTFQSRPASDVPDAPSPFFLQEAILALLAAVSLPPGTRVAIACGCRDSFDACTASLVSSDLYDVTLMSAEMGMQEIEAVASAFRKERPSGGDRSGPDRQEAGRGRGAGPAVDWAAAAAPDVAGLGPVAVAPAAPAATVPAPGVAMTDGVEPAPGPAPDAQGDADATATPAVPPAPRRRRRSPSPPPPPPRPRVLVTTDPPLRALSRESAPRGASLLVHYDMPLRPEALGRRIKSLLRKPGAGRGATKAFQPSSGAGRSSDAAVVGLPPPPPASVAFVATVDGEELSQYVAWTDILPAPMPVHASDVLTGA